MARFDYDARVLVDVRSRGFGRPGALERMGRSSSTHLRTTTGRAQPTPAPMISTVPPTPESGTAPPQSAAKDTLK
jgi:hypothetical protein